MEAVADTQAVATAAALVVIMDEMAAAVESTTYHQRHRPTGASLRANGPTECLVRSCVPARVSGALLNAQATVKAFTHKKSAVNGCRKRSFFHNQ